MNIETLLKWQEEYLKLTKCEKNSLGDKVIKDFIDYIQLKINNEWALIETSANKFAIQKATIQLKEGEYIIYKGTHSECLEHRVKVSR